MPQPNQSKSAPECYLCRTVVAELADFGKLPICNRYVAEEQSLAKTEAQEFPFVLRQCPSCGLVQINNPVPADELTSPYEWLIYNEPERHLDQLAQLIADLPGVTAQSPICGVSFLDEPLLRRMTRLGFSQTSLVRMGEDLDVTDRRAGIETIQDRLSVSAAERIVNIRGRNDVVLAAYVVEHAHDLREFIGSLKTLVSPEGYLVIQVPDSQRMMERGDYSALWEEHVLYFTPESLRGAFAACGLSLVQLLTFSYELEDCLVAIGRIAEVPVSYSPLPTTLREERRRAERFALELDSKRARLRANLSQYRREQGPVALFGAGHRACMFINLMGVRDYLEFVIDDDPHKQGYLMAGSGLPIRNSSSLTEANIKLCLLSLSPESEQKVIQNNQAFLARGGTFKSIYPDSKHALKF